MPVQQILSDLSMSSGPDIWFIGDAQIDMKCAANCQIVGIFIGDEPSDHFDQLIQLKYRTLEELKSFIHKVCYLYL